MWDTAIPGFIPVVVILGVILFGLAFSFRDRTRKRGYHDDPADSGGLHFGDTGDSSWGSDDGGSCGGGDGGGGDGGGCD